MTVLIDLKSSSTFHRAIQFGEVVLGVPPGVQNRRDDDDTSRAKASLHHRDAALADEHGLGKRVVKLAVDGARLPRLLPLDDVILFAEPRPASEIGPAMRRQSADGADAT